MKRFLPTRWRNATFSRALPALDSWHFWITLSFLIVGALGIVSFLNRANIGSERAAREQAGIARVEQCLRARTVLYPKLNRYFRGTAFIAHTLVENSEAMHAITPKSSPVYEAQAKNLARLRRAVAAVHFHLPVPSVATCEKLRQGG